MRTLHVIALAHVLALAGCPADDGQSADTGDTHDGADSADTAVDGTSGDTTSDVDAADSDSVGDADTSRDGDDSRDGGEVIEPGGFGSACTTNDDCLSGYCLDAYEGKVCSSTCGEAEAGCPSGWSCRRDLSVFPDVIFVCVPSFPTLCRPCDDTATCVANGNSAGAHCQLSGGTGDDGAFCGGACAGANCPPGYTCEAGLDVDGKETLQCVPVDAAECECSAQAIAEQATTTCRRDNTFGICTGRRTCLAAGLSDCDARDAALEVCNGQDDDCDGQTDEGYVAEACENRNALGACRGLTVCGGAGGVTCGAREPANEKCGDGTDNDCDGETDEAGATGCTSFYPDLDGDGFGAGAVACLCAKAGDTAAVGGDCDDTRGNVRPNAPEVCDGIDNDCDGATDDAGAVGCSVFYLDFDHDGFGNPNDFRCLCAADAEHGYTSKSPTDCDDQSGSANPGQAEVCDGIDNDCDTLVDEQGAGNCVLHFGDGDHDTWGNPAVFACLCEPDEIHTTTRSGDCQDADATVNPGQAERCDQKDNDCDGATDEADALGCTSYYRDSDGDFYGVTNDVRCLCAPDAPWDATLAGDCNDAAQAIHPGVAEVCNGQDDDCDDSVDEPGATGCSTYYRDLDFDSFGRTGDAACLCAPNIPYVSLNDDDCDDEDPYINPTAAEVCNQQDDNCNGQTDEGVQGNCSPFYYDGDGDGWGLANNSRCLCAPEGLYRAVKAGDCDDTVATTHPFAAELCNAVDDDCDAATDEEGARGCTTYYRDIDRDGVGQYGETRCLCAPSGLHTATSGGDCDESDPDIHPGVAEVCNSQDDDCDGVVDPAQSLGCGDLYRDSDQDGFGVSGDLLCLCSATAPYTANLPGDCNDADANASPAKTEVCNGKDDDCSGVADDPGTNGCVTFFRDDDSDTWGKTGDGQCLCGPSGAYRATSGGDCDDGRPAVNPAAPEQCNAIDDDCDAQTDEAGSAGCSVYLKDVDGDLHGVDGDFQCLCAAGATYRATVGGDCNDARVDVHVDAPEKCDGVDNDCDRLIDEEGALQCTAYLRDIDGDNFGVTGDSRCLCAATATYRATAGGDCNDGTTLIAPGATEFCNGVDDNCNAQTDEEGATGCQSFYTDSDNDGWGVGAGRCFCAASGAFTATQSPDCADGDVERNPGLPERCGGNKDEDCDGVTDEPNAVGCVDYFEDLDNDGYGVTTSRLCLCGASGNFKTTASGDCKDTGAGAANVNPGKVEVCNGLDDDCDGKYDEGCGMQTGGWPTAKYDRRRSGWGATYNGPTVKTIKWKVQLNTAGDGYASTDIQTSATFDLDGNLIIAVENRLYKLNPATGATIWQKTLTQPMSDAASVTLRDGGTIVVPTGNGLSMYDKDGTLLWYTKLPGAETEPITGSPLVDSDGTSYVVGFSAAYAVDAGGVVLWSIAVPNSQYVQSHVAWSPTTDRLYFGCSNHTLFCVTRTGQIAWTFVVASQDIDASTVVLTDGTLVQSFGSSFYHVRDDVTVGTQLGSVNTGGDNDTPPVAWKDSGGLEHFLANANGNTGVRSYRADTRALEWTYAMVKDQSIPNSTAAIDKNGRIYVGDDEGNFHAFQHGASSATALWKLVKSASEIQGSEIQSTTALQENAVYFSDNAGWLYRVGP